jgi:hypothetical protein
MRELLKDAAELWIGAQLRSRKSQIESRDGALESAENRSHGAWVGRKK